MPSFTCLRSHLAAPALGLANSNSPAVLCLQGELESVDATSAALEDHLDSAIATGGWC